MKWAEGVSKNLALCTQLNLPVGPRIANIMLSGVTDILINGNLQSLEIHLFHIEHSLYKVNFSAIFGKLLKIFKNIFQTKQNKDYISKKSKKELCLLREKQQMQ